MSTEQENIKFRQLFQDHFDVVQPLWILDGLLFMVALVGLVLNTLILFVACRRKKPWAVDVMLICLVATCDIVWCSTLLVSLISRWILGDSVLVEDSNWCQFSAISSNASLMSAIICTSVLALARYLAIVCKFSLSNRAWMGTSASLVILVWGLFIHRGFTETLFVFPAGFYCFPQIYGSDWATRIFEVSMQILIYPSLILIPICYILITIYYCRQRIKLSSEKNHLVSHRLTRGTLQLGIILLAYSIAIIPDLLHIMLSIYYGVKRTALSDGIVVILESCISSINALFVLLMHEEIQHEFRIVTGTLPGQPEFPYPI